MIEIINKYRSNTMNIKNEYTVGAGLINVGYTYIKHNTTIIATATVLNLPAVFEAATPIYKYK